MRKLNIGVLIAGLLILTVPVTTAGVLTPDVSNKPLPVPEKIICNLPSVLNVVCLIIVAVVMPICFLVFGLIGRTCPIR